MTQFSLPAWAVATAVLLAGCTNDSPAPPQPDSFPSYLPLQTGNYWVYQRYAIDGATGQATATAVFDSCFISKDTLIHGQKYYKFVRPTLYGVVKGTRYVRDSAHYVVDHHGQRLFSSQDVNILTTHYITTGAFNGRVDTVGRIVAQMLPQDTLVSTAAGSFRAKKYREKHEFYPNLFPGYQPRLLYTRYAEQVGIVTEMLPFFASDPNYTERRLLRYRVH
ncbi:hypothetical protein LJ737_11040 [Hymenobacter sp. 15J16-1T3B]|uniref:hypothetical protein n=1 Tax=Hymenobacter sp. 15J16-1T3B TaxID=2886941 RepID=UPI001D11CD06|nr:hypothetical protein [Hymenobacter sp. 15J16-1T3B]MCC3157774.1 hypothetical protein [Hymenobacter sp. 15J16-1T3B]